MRRFPWMLLLVGVALATSPLPARAQLCADVGDGMPTGPVISSTLDGNLGNAHRFCGRSEVGLGLGGLLLIDRPNFYGHLAAGGKLDGSYAVSERFEVFGSFEFLRYESVITPIAASAIGLGVSNVGAAGQLLVRDKWGLGLNGKIVLPTAAGIYQNAWPVGLDLGLAAQFKASNKVLFHVQLGGLTSFAISKGAANPRIGGVLTAGTELRPGKAFALAIDLHGNFGYRAPLDTLAAALALRFSDGKRFGFSLGAVLPFAGQERALVALDLRASIRLGPFTPHPGRTAPAVLPATTPTP